MLNIVINSNIIDSGPSILFTIESIEIIGLSASFEWYLNNNIVSNDSTYTLVSPSPGDTIYVKVSKYIETFWHDGQFYGGSFVGNFGGGTFHYGILNGRNYTDQTIKPKVFTEKTN